jgi:hypothetical protein
MQAGERRDWKSRCLVERSPQLLVSGFCELSFVKPWKLHVNESDPSKDWIVPIGHPQARDMQLIGNGRVLIGHHLGWSEFEIATGNVLFEFTAYEGVMAYCC